MDAYINSNGHLVTPNGDRHVDFFLRALGFPDRRPLTLIAKDDKTYFSDGIGAKPDYSVFDAEAGIVYCVDYKNRIPDRFGPQSYEINQVLITGICVARSIARDLRRPVSFACGLLYANDMKIEITADEGDVRRVMSSIQPAREAWAARNHPITTPYITATKLAKFMAHEIDKPVHVAAAAEGTRVQAQIVSMAPRSSPIPQR